MPSAKHVVSELAGDERAFLTRHPHPALVFEPAGQASEAGRVHVDTADQPFFVGGFAMVAEDDVGEATDILTLTAADRRALGVAVEHVGPEARIEWLTKTARNPFGSMITLGRASNNDVVVATTTVSKVHAVFAYEEGGWVVSDSHSSNGTLINGVRLPAGAKRPICNGDELGFGSEVRVRFVLPPELLQMLAPGRRALRRRDGGWV